MGAIYSAATLVLALVSGASMNDRIPGVKAHRPVYERTAKVDGLFLKMDLPDLQQAIQKSKWASRGWTYQENYLAKRKLYMTSVQLIYQCNLGEFAEDICLSYDEEDGDEEDEDRSPSPGTPAHPAANTVPVNQVLSELPWAGSYESQGLKRWAIPTRPKDHDSRLR